jgi:putative ABC transport system permease protein
MPQLRDALRALRGAPVVSAAALLSLALGIGANTAIFSILNSLLLKPLPVHAPAQLVVLGSEAPNREAISYPVWKEIRERRLFARPFAWATDRLNISTTGEVRFVEAIWATGEFFEVLGVPAVAGRALMRADDTRGGGASGAVAMISHAFWLNNFGGRNDAIGRTLRIEGVPFTIVGVTPPRFFGLNVGTGFDVVLPLETEPLLGRVPERLESPHWPWLRVMARLSPGETPAALTAALRVAQPLIRDATMPSFVRAEDREQYLRATWTIAPAPAGVSRFRQQYGAALLTLLGVVAVVLLIACANLAALMLARAAARRHEFSVRLALGASRGRLARQLLTESLLLATGGAIAGLALAHWGSRMLIAQLSTWAYTAVVDLSLDWRVLGITGATTIATAVLFGIAPAFRAARAEPNDALKQPRAVVRDGRLGFTNILVIAQLALSLVLLIGGGLFLRSFVALAYRDLGFDRDRLLIAVVDSQDASASRQGRLALYERVREAVAAVPGVESAALSMATPIGSAGIRMTPAITIPGSAVASNQEITILANPVSPGWLRTFGTRLLAGRDFDQQDGISAPHAVIVNDVFARRHFSSANPLGRRIVEHLEGNERREWEIVGLVENAAFTSVRDAVEPAMYRPLAQAVDEDLLGRFPRISLSVRSARRDPARLAPAVVAAIGSVDPSLAVSFQTLTEQLNVYYIRERLLAVLSGFFAAFALLLAGVGVYGVMSYSVSRRRLEIGIRIALGADRAGVMRMVVGRVITLIAIGIAAGTLASFWAAGSIRSLLYGLEASDPPTFAAAAAVLAGVAGLTGWLPARRASRIDAATVLREV